MSSSRSSSASSSRKPPSEKIGVRSSCDAAAMNCLRARSNRASCACMSSNAAASRPSSSTESARMGWEKSPDGHLARRPLEPLDAQRQRARHQIAGQHGDHQRDAAGDQDLAADQRDVVLDVGQRVGEHDDPGDVVLALGDRLGDDGLAARARGQRRPGLPARLERLPDDALHVGRVDAAVGRRVGDHVRARLVHRHDEDLGATCSANRRTAFSRAVLTRAASVRRGPAGGVVGGGLEHARRRSARTAGCGWRGRPGAAWSAWPAGAA